MVRGVHRRDGPGAPDAHELSASPKGTLRSIDLLTLRLLVAVVEEQYETIYDAWYNRVKGQNPSTFFGIYDVVRWDTVSIAT